MNQSTKAHCYSYFIHCLGPLHVGAGQGDGFIDLPVARERTTRFPYVPGSAIKGVVADYYGAGTPEARKKDPLLGVAFGIMPEGEAVDFGLSSSGCLAFTDARVLCMPVPSMVGTFAWATCPFVLQRYLRDQTLVSQKVVPPKPPELRSGGAGFQVLVPSERQMAVLFNDVAILDEFEFRSRPDPIVAQWAKYLATLVFADEPDWQEIFCDRFVVIDDHVFAHFTEHGTQVDPRIRIEPNSKNVQDGALWYEESLPAETILTGITWVGHIANHLFLENSQPKSQIIEKFLGSTLPIQLGGKATVGRGHVNLILRAD